MTHKLIKTDNYLLVVDDSEIKEGDYVYVDKYSAYPFIFMNPPCPTPFWGNKEEAKKIIAHLPLNGSPILEGVPLLPQLKDDVDKLANEYFTDTNPKETPYQNGLHIGFKAGFNKAREKYKYTEEDMRKAISETRKGMLYNKKYEDEYIESLHQYPTEFECEMVWTNSYGSEVSVNSYDVQSLKPKTITTAQGIQWVGKYK